MTWVQKYAEEQCETSPEFKEVYEEESAILALVRARNAADMTQKDLAEVLRVSQPYIAMIERGSKPMSLSLMLRYANAVGVVIQVASKPSKPTSI